MFTVQTANWVLGEVQDFGRLRQRLYNALQRRLLPSPVKARHGNYSMVYSEDDSVSRPSQRLLELGIESARCASTIDLSDLVGRIRGRLPLPDNFMNLWPGEHYRLLGGLVQVMRPKLVIEIGTAEGLSALTLLKYLPEDGSVVTFDIVPWREYPGTCLEESDFASAHLHQQLGDLADPEVFMRHQRQLIEADIVFVDAPKDGIFEKRLIANLQTIQFENSPIFVFDDIRLWNMLRIWRELRWPKLDMTSFGHWSGTGICEPIPQTRTAAGGNRK